MSEENILKQIKKLDEQRQVLIKEIEHLDNRSCEIWDDIFEEEDSEEPDIELIESLRTKVGEYELRMNRLISQDTKLEFQISSLKHKLKRSQGV
ncbi:MAG: hypothetical protein CL489_10455 [Acidobacteria bacterium]|nr:hypothetical protein [Acidobacteriota bacterium]|tara:strand:+ start:642 stop:923 length:282 start_codon:yes stop_codon:yes gene_type:complete